MKSSILAMALALTAAFSVAGCAQLEVKPGYQLAKPSGKGVLSLGITADNSMPDFYWHLRHVPTGRTVEVPFYSSSEPLMWANPRGRLAIIELEEGDYEIFDWQMLADARPVSYFRIPFSIRAGKVTYLGRLHLKLDRAEKQFSIEATQQWDADRFSLANTIAHLHRDAVTVQEAVLRICADSTCRSSRAVNITVPTPVR